MPSAAENYTVFEKQILVQYWAPRETECLTVGYQGTTYPGAYYELGPARPPSNEVRWAQEPGSTPGRTMQAA